MAKSSRLSLAADSSHKRLQEESSPSHANFLANGNNLTQYPEQSIHRSSSISNNKNKQKLKNWFTYLFHNTFGCDSCQHRRKHNSSKRSGNLKPFTTDSSYTFQRSPPAHHPISQLEGTQMKPDLLVDEDRSIAINSFVPNDRSPTRHEIVDFSLDTNMSHQHSSSLENNIVEFERMAQSARCKVKRLYDINMQYEYRYI